MSAPRPWGLPGLLRLELDVRRDPRGWFKENWNRSRLAASGLPGFAPVQHNLAFNTSVGTTRGFHAEPWDKLVSVATGRVFGAWVDLRPGPGFGRTATAEIDEGAAVFVPRGVANAYQSLLPGTSYSYLVDQEYAADTPGRSRYVCLGDPALGIPWPIPLERAVLSEADLAHPPLNHVDPLPPARILVLGGDGQLGHALRERAAADPRIEVLGRAEAELGCPGSLEALDLRDTAAVINAAAHTRVDEAETPGGARAAWATNATGVGELAGLCSRAGVELLHVSTDYVLSGASEEAPTSEAPAPLNVYGASKAAGETAVLATGGTVVRTSWLYGNGRHFVRSMAARAAAGEGVRVVDDQIGRLTSAPELAGALVRLADGGPRGVVLHLQGGGRPLSWAGIAREVYAALGADPGLATPITSAHWAQEHPGSANRPPRSVLALDGNERLGLTMSDHVVALRAWLASEWPT